MMRDKSSNFAMASVFFLGALVWGLAVEDGTHNAWAEDDEQAAVDNSEDAAPETATASTVELVDPAFGQYIDIRLLWQGWGSMDAGMLTDAALQLAEGERVLMRSHKAGSALQTCCPSQLGSLQRRATKKR